MQSVKKIWNIITTLLVIVVAVLAVLLAGVRVFGVKPFTVLSGSMEPVYHVGSLIYVKEVEDPRNIPDGTIITFMLSEETVATHRIVAAVPDEEDPSTIRYRTKGDANDAEDGTLVHYKNIIGTPVFSVPKLGYLADFIQNPPGMYIAMSAGAILLMLVFLPDILFDEPKKKDAEEPAEKKEKKEKPARPARKKPGRYVGKYSR